MVKKAADPGGGRGRRPARAEEERGGGHEGRRRPWTCVPRAAGRADPAGVEEVVPYRSYLLRLWPVRREGLASVRVSIDDVVTGEHRDFSDLETLFLFLGGGARSETDPS